MRISDWSSDVCSSDLLPAEALGGDAGADAFARSIDRRCRAGRTDADDQHVVRRPGIELLGVTRRRAGVELGDDLLDVHAALADQLAIEEHADRKSTRLNSSH